MIFEYAYLQITAQYFLSLMNQALPVNPLRPSYVYIYASVNWVSLVQIMARRLFGTKPLSQQLLEYH